MNIIVVCSVGDLLCSSPGSQTCSRCNLMAFSSLSFPLSLPFLPPSLSSLPLFPPSLSFLPLFLSILSLSSLPLFPLSLSFLSPSLSSLLSPSPSSLPSVVPPRHQSMSISSHIPHNYQGTNGGGLPHMTSLSDFCVCSCDVTSCCSPC